MKKHTLKHYYIHNYMGRLSLYYLVLLAYLFISFIIPILISSFIDSSIEARQIFNFNLLFLALFCVAEMIFSSTKDELNIRLSNKISFHIEYFIADHIKHSDYEQIKKYDDAYLAQRINNDAVIVGDYICEKFPYFITDICSIIFILLYLTYIDWMLGCIFIGGTIIYILSYVITNKYLFKLAEKMFDAQASFFAMLSDQFNSILLIKINSWYEEKNKEFKEIVGKFYIHSLRYLRLEFIRKDGGMFFCRILMILAMCEIGINILNGNSSIGMMTSLVLYTEIIVSKLNSANSFGDSYQKYKLANKRLSELRSYDLEKNGEQQLTHIDHIELKNVSYNVGNRELIYPDVRFIKGNIYVLKGENGSGKSTLTNLLLGILHCSKGETTYNGTKISDINMNVMRRNIIAVKNQTPYIIDGNLKRNILFGNEKSIPSTIQNFINKFLDFSKTRGGWNMNIMHRNTELSGGEQQRIAISRALCKDGDFLILDEPTNGLDDVAKYDLLSALDNMKDKIVLVITHDECFDKIADEILQLE